MENTKTCQNCEKELPIEDFPYRIDRNRYRSQCKECYTRTTYSYKTTGAKRGRGTLTKKQIKRILRYIKKYHDETYEGKVVIKDVAAKYDINYATMKRWFSQPTYLTKKRKVVE